MEPPVLTDKDQFPADEILFSHLGKKKPLWISLYEFIHLEYPNFQEAWRYYNDGKSWLLKITNKKKTVFWCSIIKNGFRITFYFTNRAEQAINESGISSDLIEQFKSGKQYNKIRGLTINFKNKKDIQYAKSLIAIKLNVR
jgi:hypothetical protein